MGTSANLKYFQCRLNRSSNFVVGNNIYFLMIDCYEYGMANASPKILPFHTDSNLCDWYCIIRFASEDKISETNANSCNNHAAID